MTEVTGREFGAMKSFIKCFILCGLVVLVGCGGGSPKPPASPPTGDDEVWLITDLQASESNPVDTGFPVTMVAKVTLNGETAPDGTNVEFTANGGVFVVNGETAATVLTSSGDASVTFAATSAGSYSIQARVRTAVRRLSLIHI